MSKRKRELMDRAEKVAQMRAAQRRRERVRTVLVIGAAVVASVMLATVVGVVVARERDRQQEFEAAADAPIEGVEEFEDLSRQHVQGPVSYDQTPPAGGNHAGVWTNCGVYTEPLVNEQTVHSLEHGAVWITYQPDVSADQVQALTDLAQPNPYALLSPFEGLPNPVVASAWGVQLGVEDANDPRLALFLEKYAQGEQSPEPGAPCTGGV